MGKSFRYLFILAAIVGSGFAHAEAPSCNSVFSADPSHIGESSAKFDFAKTYAREVNWSDWQVVRAKTKLSRPDSSGGEWFMNESWFSAEVEYGENKSAASYLSYSGPFNARTRSVTSENALKNSMGLRQFRNIKAKALDFVINAYQERRPHWTPSFLAKLRKLANEYERESAYLTVESKDWQDPSRRKDNNGHELSYANLPQNILGTMRLIHEREGFLPMEKYLGLELQVPSSNLKVEPGNFAMAKEANEIATIELSIQILSQIHRYKAEFGKEPWFATYADQFSEKLYGSLGFKYMPQELIKKTNEESIIEVDDSGVFRVIKDNVRWAPMYATAEMMSSILMGKLELIARRSDRESQEKAKDLYGKFVSAVKQSRDAVSGQAGIFRGRVSRSLDSRINVGVDLKIRTSSGKKKELYLKLGDEWRNDERTSIMIPVPIPEGYKVKDANGFTIEYKNGVLKKSWVEKSEITNTRSFETQEIWIDSMLTNPTRARLTLGAGSSFEQYMEIMF